MKKQLFILLVFFLFIVSKTFSQSFTFDISKVNDFIVEVYADVVNDLGYNSPEGTERFTKVLKRFEIITSTTLPENYRFLSEIPVINTYNKELKSEEIFDPQNFNPFKYKFDVFSKDRTVYYLVDNTDYIIIIHPDQKF
ncbi:MAG: hypothetical protein H0X63_13210 [Flavobacteriales bacterium]|jgi:hypothetical protein|nr:hypothetical protein [Flavobacteriales bacterium]